jgi:16S rRNA (guanine(966)-N(2))-methyltransferase RsmD
MRVISGKARGTVLKTPDGMQTRPTTDRVKEALFSIIQFDLPGTKVLDLFGGTGQLGIEALSRGARHCTFVEMRRDAVSLLKENLKITTLQDNARVVQGDSIAFLSSCREQFDVILLDPPYHTDLMDRAIESILRFDILAEHGIMVCETAADRELPALSEELFEPGRSYRYGQIKLSIFRRKGKERKV